MGMVTVVFLDDLNMPAKEVRLACLEMLLFPWICSLPGTPTLPLAGALALPGNARLAHYLLTSRHTNPSSQVRFAIFCPRLISHPLHLSPLISSLSSLISSSLSSYVTSLSTFHISPRPPSRSTARSRPSRSSASGWTTRAGTTAKKTSSVASSTSRCDWPAWKCPPAPVSAHFQAPQPPPPPLAGALPCLEMPQSPLCRLTSRHLNPPSKVLGRPPARAQGRPNRLRPLGPHPQPEGDWFRQARTGTGREEGSGWERWEEGSGRG